MIQFCEDCGQNNTLDITQIQEGKAVFTCSECNYHNSFNLKSDEKIYFKKLSGLPEIIGVDQYVLVDQNQNIATHNIQNPEKTARIILSCAKKSFSISKSKSKYVVFPRKNQKHFFIFLTGNSYLGVIKQHDISDKILINNILNYLKKLS